MQLCQCIGVVVAALSTFIDTTSLLHESNDIDVLDKYIITLEREADMFEHIRLVQDLHTESLRKREDGQGFDGITHQYNMSDFRAYAGHFDASVVEHIRARGDVALVEADQLYSATGFVAQPDASYSLNLISHRGLDKRSQAEGYVYDSSSGAGTWSYIVDSGINVDHREFESRASNGYNAARPEEMKDTFGHGTHMAAIVGGMTFGVAKKTNLIAVKVMKGFQTPGSKVVDGYQWAVKDILSKNRQAKAVINLAVGGGYVQALNKAIDEAYKSGVTTVVAFGNQGEQSTWPRSAIAVSSTDKNRKWSGSLRNARTTIFAPGASIKSAWIGSAEATKSMSGSSPAAAHVAGLVAYFKGMRRLSDAKQTQQTLVTFALRNVVGDAGQAPNLFAYNGSGK